MKTNNKWLICLYVFVFTLAIPFMSSGSDRNATDRNKNPEAAALIQRLEEIKGMDTKNMTRSEKRELRREVKSIKKRIDNYGGIYISAGALLVIILLILLL